MGAWGQRGVAAAAARRTRDSFHSLGGIHRGLIKTPPREKLRRVAPEISRGKARGCICARAARRVSRVNYGAGVPRAFPPASSAPASLILPAVSAGGGWRLRALLESPNGREGPRLGPLAKEFSEQNLCSKQDLGTS
jgi:hypothetical protein